MDKIIEEIKKEIYRFIRAYGYKKTCELFEDKVIQCNNSFEFR